jgi:hypothetical protein
MGSYKGLAAPAWNSQIHTGNGTPAISKDVINKV